MDVVAESKRLYEPFLDDDDRAMVESLSVPDQAYFWTMLYYEIPHSIGRSVLDDLERKAILGTGVSRTVIRASVQRATSLDGLWDTTKPHAWFKAVL